VFEILDKVDAMGGTVRAIEHGYFQRAIAESAYEYERRKASGEQVVVGVNKYVDPPEPANIEIHRTDPAAEARQVQRLRTVRMRRNNAEVERLLDRLAAEALDPSKNLLPTTIELVKARASMGEIVQRLRAVFGQYVETPVF
jgi:methylmalonyl-CoA mutase N-terminal domain/subunit